MGHTNVFH